MNILVLSWRDPKHPLAGGAEQVMHEHMKGWVKAGHTVTLFASYFEGAKNYESLEGIKIIRKGSQILGVHLAAFLWYCFQTETTYDVIVDQFHGIPFFTPLYARCKKVAVIQEVARNVWLKNHLPKPFNWIIGFLGLITEPFYFYVYRNTPIITGSASAKDDVIKMGIKSSHITIVPHGVKLEIPKPLPPKEKKTTIVFLGAIAKDKGIEDAIKTFSILKSQGISSFWIIGKAGDQYMKEIQRLLLSLGMKNTIKFWGFVDEKKKFELLARAHVLINPSVHEGWGLVNIEANSVGTPVAAYQSPGLVDSVHEGVNGVFSKQKTPESLASVILDLTKDKAKLKKLSMSSQKYSKQFNWEVSKALSLKYIEKVASKEILAVEHERL